MSELITIHNPTGEAVEYNVWGSGGLSGLKDLMSDPKCGTYHKPKKVFANKECKGIEWAKKQNLETKIIPSKKYNIKEFPEDRETYFGEVFDWMMEDPPEITALSGFMMLIPETFIKKFPYQFINVHPANLAKMRFSGNGYIFDAGDRESSEINSKVEKGELERAFTGDDAVYDAMLALEDELMSTIHYVNEVTDGGPIFTRKPRATKVDIPFVKQCIKYGNLEELKQYKETFQGHMKPECDGLAYRNAFKTLYTNKVEIEPATETLFFNGIRQPYGGVKMAADAR